MSGKSTGSTGPDRKIQDILDGNIEAYVSWAEMRIHGLERNREYMYLKKQAKLAEQRCAAAERMHRMAMESDAAQRERAAKAEKRLAQTEARLAEMATKRQSATNRPLERAIAKLARNPVIVKKLVLVCHPDKVPSEVSDSATELFRFLQSIRDNTKT
jgi:hypothetical protein